MSVSGPTQQFEKSAGERWFFSTLGAEFQHEGERVDSRDANEMYPELYAWREAQADPDQASARRFHDIARQAGLAERTALIGSIQPQILTHNFLP